MRMASCGSIKGRPTNRRDIPSAGSRIRVAFDLLVSNKAAPVSLKFIPNIHRKKTVDYLKDAYGLDVRAFRRPGHGYEGDYWLVGEWVGAVYVDYLLERRNKEEQYA